MTEKQEWTRFEYEDDDSSSGLKKWLPKVGAGTLVMLLAVGVAALVNNMSGTAPPSEPFVQQISIIRPPPPPPPPKIDEPEPKVEDIKLDEPEPEIADDLSDLDEALGEELGLDADGVSGSDQFGLLAKRGGRSLIGGDPFAWYGSLIQRELQRLLANRDRIRRGDYSVIVSIWLGKNGEIEDSELVSGTNDPKMDAALRDALSSGIRISRSPPDDLPQPIRLRITSRT